MKKLFCLFLQATTGINTRYEKNESKSEKVLEQADPEVQGRRKRSGDELSPVETSGKRDILMTGSEEGQGNSGKR
jgi:hypothetical protein